jgi:hypothetical protein
MDGRYERIGREVVEIGRYDDGSGHEFLLVIDRRSPEAPIGRPWDIEPAFLARGTTERAAFRHGGVSSDETRKERISQISLTPGRENDADQACAAGRPQREKSDA